MMRPSGHMVIPPGEHAQLKDPSCAVASGETAEACPPAARHPEVAAALAGMKTISLEEMQDLSLLNRTDTKYLLTEQEVCGILRRLAPHYRLLETRAGSLNLYRTLYFDTPDLVLYRRHHAGRKDRHKIRSREYAGAGLTFLEIKRKTNKGRTVKTRVRTASATAEIDGAAQRFLDSHVAADGVLNPVLLNEFVRLTLVSREHAERITVDVGLRFFARGKWAELPGLAIVEVKQAGFDRSSPAVREMRAAHIAPRRISKYCTGISLLYEDVKHNAFKPRLLAIKKLTGESNHG